MLKKALISVILVFLAGLSHAAPPDIDTTLAWDGAQSVIYFGKPNTQTYGQVITAPAGPTELSNFSFRIQVESGAVVASGMVYAWDGAKATGPALFHSAPVTIPSTGNFEVVSFAVAPALTFTPGQQYVLFATTSFEVGGAGAAGWGVMTSGATKGHMVYQNNGNDTSLWTSSNWQVWNPMAQLAFTAKLAPVVPTVTPVPVDNLAMLVALAGLMGVAGLWRVRRRSV